MLQVHNLQKYEVLNYYSFYHFNSKMGICQLVFRNYMYLSYLRNKTLCSGTVEDRYRVQLDWIKVG